MNEFNELMSTYYFVMVAVLGVMVGSFTNVCILRMPLNESVVVDSSHCTSCEKKLKWWELIPVLSYIALRGKCSKCGAPISIQYPIIELVHAILWVLVYMNYGMTIDTILGCLLTSNLLILSVIDWRTFEIPVQLNRFIFMLGLVRTIFYFDNWSNHLIGMVVVSGVLLLMFILSKGSAIGGGDVKLMFGAGLFLGAPLVILAFLLACALGSIIHVFRMVVFKVGRTLAMGPYLAASIFIAFLWGNDMISWYLSLLY